MAYDEKTGLKHCNGCDRWLQPLADFHKCISSASGYEPQCKHCVNAKVRAKRQERVAKRRAELAAKPVAIPQSTQPELPSRGHKASLWECGECRARFPSVTRPPEAVGQSVVALPPVDVPPEFEITVEEPPPDPLTEAVDSFEQRRGASRLRGHNNALLKENERLKAELDAAHTFRSRPPDLLIYDKAKSERADSVAVVMASDWHVEEVVEKHKVHGLNEYSPEIARSRAQHFFQNSLKLALMMARDTDIKTLFLAALGDFFSGYIHEELLANNAMPPADAAWFVRDLLCSGIDFWLRESSFNIEGLCLPGNHGRMTDRMWASNVTGTSLEVLVYRALADHYHDNPRVRLEVPDHAMVYKTFFESYVVRYIHGYEIKFLGGIGGLTIPVRKAIAQWDMGKQAKLTCMGHFHQRVDGGNFMINGSLIGFSEYSLRIKAQPEEAAQQFFLIHARKGGDKSLTAPVWLDDEHQLKPPAEAVEAA